MWARLLNTAFGLWLMIAPAVLNYQEPARTNDRIVGPLAITFAVVAIWEATRPLRWVNAALGTWLLLAPWVLGYGGLVPIVNSTIVGILLLAFALVRGPIRERVGGGWSAIWRTRPPE